MIDKEKGWKKWSYILLIVAFILSVSLNLIFLSGYENKEKKTELNVEQEKARLNAFLDSIKARSFRVWVNFYPTMDIDEFRDFARNHGLKPVIFFGYNFGDKKEFDEQLINKYNLKYEDYITDIKQIETFLQKYKNESWIMGHYSVVIENGKIVYGEIAVATTSNLTKLKIKELINDKRVHVMELGTIGY